MEYKPFVKNALEETKKGLMDYVKKSE